MLECPQDGHSRQLNNVEFHYYNVLHTCPKRYVDSLTELVNYEDIKTIYKYY